MGDRSNPITISRRMLAVGLISSGALGVAAGELAAPLSASQASATTASVAACKSFATDVAGALRDLSVAVSTEGKYALFIPEAYKDGQTKNTADYLSISTRLEGLVKQVLAQNNAFQKLEGPLVSTEKQCIA